MSELKHQRENNANFKQNYTKNCSLVFMMTNYFCILRKGKPIFLRFHPKKFYNKYYLSCGQSD